MDSFGHIIAAALGAVALAAAPGPLRAGATDLVSAEVSFAAGDGSTRYGTVIAPAGDQPPAPAMVLVHGGGAGPREWLRQEAEAFARSGIITLIYDKRTDGYSLTQRSYRRLADDALAAVRLLQTWPGVDPRRVGLWGVSEGGWVAPLAAVTSQEVAFVVTVGASGVPPARQEAWAKANRLRQAGVSGSMARVYPLTTVRLMVDAGLFPEADHDPRPVLRQLRQPVLAVWGAHDVVSPPAESLSSFADAFDQGGNPSYTLRVLADGDHAGYRATGNGFAVLHWISDTGRFADGYIELVATWVDGLADGPPPSSVDVPPAQTTMSMRLSPRQWYESAMVHLAALVIMVAVYAAHTVRGFIRFGRRSRRRAGSAPAPPTTATRAAGWLALAGLTTLLAWASYVGALLLSSERLIGPVVFGRSVPWLGLQALSVATVVAAATAVTAHVRDQARPDLAQLVLLVTATVVFVPWALSWGLLTP